MFGENHDIAILAAVAVAGIIMMGLVAWNITSNRKYLEGYIAGFEAAGGEVRYEMQEKTKNP